jgi:hypothetical protein
MRDDERDKLDFVYQMESARAWGGIIAFGLFALIALVSCFQG